MKKSNEQILIENGYTFIKENPETGWVQIAVTEDAVVSAFWIPSQLFHHITDIHYLKETINLIRKIKDKDAELIVSLETKIKEYLKKIDPQRKSISYYKGERDSLHYTNNKTAKLLATTQTEYKEKLQKFERIIDLIQEEDMRKSEDIEMLKHRNKFLTTICYFIGGCFVSLLLFFSL